MTVIRAAITSVLAGTSMAAAVFVISVTGAFPRVWPGVAVGFLSTSCATFLLLTRGER
jgi:hypothetical protein